MSEAQNKTSRPIVLAPGQGRLYDMGRMKAIFKTDGSETDSRYSVSEWWLEPDTAGPGVHHHSEDHVFIVVEGRLSVFLDDVWITCEKGAFLLIPGNTPHDFENRSSRRTGFITFNIPGGFESQVPDIVQWFKENPLGKAKVK